MPDRHCRETGRAGLRGFCEQVKRRPQRDRRLGMRGHNEDSSQCLGSENPDGGSHGGQDTSLVS